MIISAQDQEADLGGVCPKCGSKDNVSYVVYDEDGTLACFTCLTSELIGLKSEAIIVKQEREADAKEIRESWRIARGAGSQTEAFRVIERMVDRLGYGRRDGNPSLIDPIWIKGRALVYDEAGEVEYFEKFEDGSEIGCAEAIRTSCGGLRPVDKCRPLAYVKVR